jgi:hypothetical protein
MPDLSAFGNEGWLWLGGSLLLAAFATNAVNFLLRSPSSAPGAFITRLTKRRFFPWLLQSFRLLYYIGVPFAALLWGHDALIVHFLGIQRLEMPKAAGATFSIANWLDWASDLEWVAALGVGAWLLLTLGLWTYRRAIPGSASSAPDSTSSPSAWITLREAAYHEIHWSFYRNAPIVAWGPYLGAWIGLALAAVEAMLNPFWWEQISSPQHAPRQLLRGALAIVSGLTFLLTQNLWLMLALHWVISWSLSSLWNPVLSSASTDPPTASSMQSDPA